MNGPSAPSSKKQAPPSGVPSGKRGRKKPRGEYHRKRSQTRRKLLEAAKAVMARRGIEAATISEIAAEAGLVPGTVYNYFDTKDEILEAVAADLALQFRRVMEEIERRIEDPAERLALTIRLFLQRLQADPLWGWFMARFGPSVPILRDETRELVRNRILADGLRSGRFQLRSTRAIGDLVSGASLAALRSILDGRESISIAPEVAALVLRAVGLSEDEALEVASRPIPTLAARPRTDADGRPVASISRAKGRSPRG